MKNIDYSIVGLHVAVVLSDKQRTALLSSVRFLIVKGYDLYELREKLACTQTPHSFDLCDIIQILRSIVATIDSFELNEEMGKPMESAYKMHYIFNKIRYELEYGGN
jgi:hypothetical protein